MKPKHLKVTQEYLAGRKTPIYKVYNLKGDYLGKVHWLSTWRQYVWEQEPDTYMSKGCCNEMWQKIEDFEVGRTR